MLPIQDLSLRPGSVRKEVFDRVMAFLLLLGLSPLMLLIWGVIRLTSPGAALFTQQRGGRGGGSFSIYKFRTLEAAAAEDESAPQVRPGDKRIVPLGRLLRESSLDELPQLWNVLKGDMSLIGPRPHPLAHDAYYTPLLPEYKQRLRMKPGITGLAQVSGARGYIDSLQAMQRRVEFDNAYIDGWSFGQDMLIAVRTVVLMLTALPPFLMFYVCLEKTVKLIPQEHVSLRIIKWQGKQ